MARHSLAQSGRLTLAILLAGFAAPAIAQAPPTLSPAPAPPPDGEGEGIIDPALPADAGLPGGSLVYIPSDFAAFAPRNALDLLERVPGFAIQGQNNARGLGQASGNVLINGERPSSKSASLTDLLSRVPLGNVVRIEIVDGASLQIPGLSGRVANVIVEGGSLAGQFSYRPQISTGPAPVRWSQARVSVAGERGPVRFTVAFENQPFANGSEGPNLVVENGIAQERFSTQTGNNQQPRLNANLVFDLPGSAVANLNLAGGLGFFRAREREFALDNNQPFLDEQLRTRNNSYFYEISGDVDFAFGPGRLKLIALESYDSTDFTTQSLLLFTGRNPSGTRFERSGGEGERIGRAEYRWSMLGGDWQLSGEAAFNRLDNTSRLFVLRNDGEYAEVPFPSGSGGVREDRYEVLLSQSRSITPRLSMQLIVGGEYSRIAQTGADALSRTFQRPKGSLSLAWDAPFGIDVNFEAARRVGQLNFGDFLARVNLTDDNTNSGNNELRPQQSWEFELELARNFGDLGSLTLRLIDQRIEDFITIIPRPGGGESSGNIDSAHRYGFVLNGTLRLDRLGLEGGRIDLNLNGDKTSLLDPLTGEPRDFDRISPRNFRLDFRHDVPATDWAWGLEFRDTRPGPYYRISEIGVDYNIRTFGAVYVEHKDVLGLTVQARVGNLFRSDIVLQRTVFAGPRTGNIIRFTEDRRRDVGFVFNLDISGSF